MQKKLNDDEYRCSLCGGVFQKVRDETWSEELAIEEMESYFGKVAKEDMRVVCDDCWQKIRPDNFNE